jgi:lipoprotein-anchoring transpeptidase ErfK/SrfK
MGAWYWIFVTFALLAILLGVLGAMGWIWFTSFENTIQTGVSVDGVALGGLTLPEAVAKLDQTWNHRQIILSDETSQWKTSPAFVGLWMDPAATLQQEQVFPAKEISWAAIEERWNPGPHEIHPVVNFDRGVAKSQLTHWGAQLNRPAVDAELRLENGKAVTVPATAGSSLDVDRTLNEIAADPLAAFSSGEVKIYFHPVAPEVADVSAAAGQLSSLLNLPLGGIIYDPIKDEKIPWQIPKDQVAAYVILTHSDQGYLAVFDREKLATYLAELSGTVDLGPERAIDPVADPLKMADEMLAGQAPVLVAHYLPTEYTVQTPETLMQVGWRVGMQLWRLEKANPGVNPNALRPGDKLVIPAKTDLLPLPVVVNKRVLISITRQRMWVYEDGQQIQEFIISTGIANSPTQPGVYQIQTHDPNAYAANWDLYMPHWMGIYEAWPDFMNGIHGLPMLSSGVRLWANVLGKPASYGCIILNLKDAAWLYNWAENGVVVEIQA